MSVSISEAELILLEMELELAVSDSLDSILEELEAAYA